MFVEGMIGRDFELWKTGDSVFIEAPTGTGKTTFILESLLPYVRKRGKELLYLSNRFLLKEQVKVEIAKKQNIPLEQAWLEGIEEFDGITVMSYQRLQEKCKEGRERQYLSGRYEIIVWDEIHYILEDSAFNPAIVWLLDFLQDAKKTSIFISATMDEIKKVVSDLKYKDRVIWRTLDEKSEYLKTCLVDSITGRIHNLYPQVWFYSFKEEINNKKIKYFLDYDEIAEKIKTCPLEDRWLIFMSNKSKAKKLQEQLKDAELLSADERDGDALKEILENQKFSCRILIATKILDNGITLKDLQLKHIVIDTISKTEFIQMAGRKRFLNEDDSATYYIPKKETRFFSGYQQTGLKEVMKVLEKEWTTDMIIRKLYEDISFYDMLRRFFCWKDGKFQKNSMAVFYYTSQKNFVDGMIDAMKADEWSYIKEQLSWLGLRDTFDTSNALVCERQEEVIKGINQRLGTLVGKQLVREEQLELRSFITESLKKANIQIAEGKRLAGLSLLNRFFREYQIPFDIKSKEASKKGVKTVWMVEAKKTCVGL